VNSFILRSKRFITLSLTSAAIARSKMSLGGLLRLIFTIDSLLVLLYSFRTYSSALIISLIYIPGLGALLNTLILTTRAFLATPYIFPAMLLAI
jgi:hypothetical protein